MEEGRDELDGLLGALQQVGVPDVGKLLQPRELRLELGDLAGQSHFASTGGQSTSYVPLVISRPLERDDERFQVHALHGEARCRTVNVEFNRVISRTISNVPSPSGFSR